jgi:hypothetical protein
MQLMAAQNPLLERMERKPHGSQDRQHQQSDRNFRINPVKVMGRTLYGIP